MVHLDEVETSSIEDGEERARDKEGKHTPGKCCGFNHDELPVTRLR